MRRESQKARQKKLRKSINASVSLIIGDTKTNVILFKTKQEEKEKLEDFNGIFVRIHPDVPFYAEILEVISKEGIQRPIAITDVLEFDTFYEYKENKQRAINVYKNRVIADIAKNYDKALEDRRNCHREIHIDIAISAELAEILFGSCKLK